MPHLVILYTANLDAPEAQGGTDLDALCRVLANTMIEQRDETGKPVFPLGGTRVLAYPARHWAVGDGGAAGRAAGHPATAQAGATPPDPGDYAFVYLNLRMGRGRSEEVMQRAGQALEAAAKAHFARVLANRYIGITLQIDVGQEVFDSKNSSLHPLFGSVPTKS